jgi:two-component system LytT family response regulator
MSRLEVLIADDEEVARTRLARLLALMPDVQVSGQCRDGAEVLARVRAGGVDVVLLDIQMPGLSGLEAITLLPEGGPYVIFCTAHAEHALAAFDVGAVDYLLKPVEAGRLRKALERARSREALRRFHQQARQLRQNLPRLAVPTREGIVLIDPVHISHAALEGELVTIYTSHGDHLTDFSLQELQDKLPPGAFDRVHRKALLNLEQVTRLEPCPTGGLVARTTRGHAVEISRQAARALRRRLGLRRGGEADGGDGDD